MKSWKKPTFVMHNCESLNDLIKANAWTCLVRFLR